MAEVGRPTKFKEEYIEEVDVYLSECKDEYDEFHKTRGAQSDSYQRLIRVKLPTIEGFALRLDVSDKTLYTWSKKSPEFLLALGKIKREQKERLFAGSLSGEYNPVIAKLILSANHGMAEKTETDHTSKGEKIEGFNFIKNKE